MVAEGNTFKLVIACQYAGKTIFAGDMLPGIVIPNAYLADATEVEFGTQIKVPQVMFRGIATFGYDGSYNLFNSTIPTLPEIN